MYILESLRAALPLCDSGGSLFYFIFLCADGQIRPARGLLVSFGMILESAHALRFCHDLPIARCSRAAIYHIISLLGHMHTTS
jgi:hypothetical protein